MGYDRLGRQRTWAWCTAILVMTLAGWPLASASGQDQPAPAEPKAEPAAAPAAPAAAPVAEPAEASVARQSFLAYCFYASPVFFFIMAGISIYLGERVVTNARTLRLPKVVPPLLVSNLDAMLNERKFKEAYDLIRADQSLFARAVTAGVERLSHGFDRGVDAMVTIAEDGKLDLEHKVSPVATIAAVSPMLGLLGTVIGMVLAFQTISLGGQPKPAELARDIGLALVTTLEGLVIAIPAITAFAYLRNRISRLTFEVESMGETYLWRFAGALKK